MDEIALKQPSEQVAVAEDLELTTGDPRAIQLTDQREIAMVIGTPPAEIPKTADFSNAWSQAAPTA